MRKGKIILEVDNEHMEFDVFKIMKSTPVEVASRIESIDIIDKCTEEVIHEHLKHADIKPLAVIYVCGMRLIMKLKKQECT